MKIKKINSKLEKYLVKKNLVSKWKKTKKLLETNLSHPSLNFEKIILNRTVLYSFRLDKKYRGICVFKKNTLEILMFTNHYQ